MIAWKYIEGVKDLIVYEFALSIGFGKAVPGGALDYLVSLVLSDTIRSDMPTREKPIASAII